MFPRGSRAPQTITVPISDVLIPGPNKIFYVNLSNPLNATISRGQGTAIIQAPTLAKCQSCGLSCDDGNVCTTNTCDAMRGCIHVNSSAAATPYCQLVGGQNGTTCNSNGSWVDSDGDGFSDAAELQGYLDVNANGIYDPGIDIPLPGADPHKPDIYLHYDYTVSGDHTHNPPLQAIQYIVDAFAAHGVNLHIDPQHNAICENAGDIGCITAGTGAHVVTLGAPGSGLTDPSCAGPSAVSMRELRDAIPELALIKPAYHYMVFAHYASTPTGGGPWTCPTDPETPACGSLVSQPPLPGSLGTSEIGGNDSIVATQPFVDSGSIADLVSIPTEWWAALSMHELGHNFGLLHGGADCFNNKPNYVSVMNYRFYVSAIPVGASLGDTSPQSCTTDNDCHNSDHAVPAHCSTLANTCFRIDYSDRLFNDLDENNLDETVGLLGGANNTDISYWHAVSPAAFVHVATNGLPIDWNKNGSFGDTGIVQEINGDGQLTPLAAQNDWETILVNGVNNITHLQFAYQCSPDYSASMNPTELLLNNKNALYATTRPNFKQLLQEFWREALQQDFSGVWPGGAVGVSEAASPQGAKQRATSMDWVKEKLW
jgi:hypothetical protein